MLIVTQGGVTPTDLIPSVYLEDFVYIKLGENSELRAALLEVVGKDFVVVDRLGKEAVEGEVYTKMTPSTNIRGFESEREVGYYIRL